MKKRNIIIIGFIGLFVFWGSGIYAMSFSFLNSNFRSDQYTDSFLSEYNKLFVNSQRSAAKDHANIYKSVYFLWLDSYIYEVSDNAKADLTQKAKDSLKKYVEQQNKDKKTLNPKETMDFVMDEVFNSIDAHTTWINSIEAKVFLQRLSGQYKGIGILFNFDKNKNKIFVVKVFENSPAQKAGLLKNDYIVAVDGKPITKDSVLQDVVDSIKGENNTYVTLTIERKDTSFDLKVLRGDYYIPSVESEVFENKYGYININSFNNDTANLFRVALNSMNVNNLEGLIIDVRGNPGGLLTAVVLIADTMLSGETIVSIKGRTVENNQSFLAINKTQINEKIPVVLLINSTSASASELLAGALALNNRATIIGENSFGKWSVQSSFSLKDGSILNLTTQLFYAPKNATYQGIGIAPDIEVIGPYYNKTPREKDYKNYLKTKDVDNVKRSAKISIDEKKCGNATYQKEVNNPDYTLNCGVLYLKSRNMDKFISALK